MATPHRHRVDNSPQSSEIEFSTASAEAMEKVEKVPLEKEQEEEEEDDEQDLEDGQQKRLEDVENAALPSAPTPGPPPDGGPHAWMTVAGAFCGLFVSFGWINCERADTDNQGWLLLSY